VLLLGIGIATLGYGYTAVLNVSLFSKILEGVDQGTWMGYFNSAGKESICVCVCVVSVSVSVLSHSAPGGASRIVAPILSGYAFQFTGGK
jgi:hypothetical protein